METKRVHVLSLVKLGLYVTIFIGHTTFLFSDAFNAFFGQMVNCALELFFVVSGFLVVISNYHKEIKTVPYFLKKLKAIYPAHILGYLLCFFLQYQKGELTDLALTVKTSIVNLLFLQSYTYQENYVFSYNGVTWFLSTLVFCYLLTPITLKFMKKANNHALFVLLLVIIVRFIYKMYYDTYVSVGAFCYTNVFPPYRFLEFFSGMLLGQLFCTEKEKWYIKTKGIQELSFILFFAALYVAFVHGSRFNVWILVLELFLMYTLVFSDGLLTKLSKLRVVAAFDKIGLPFFIFHQIVIKYANYYFFPHVFDIPSISSFGTFVFLFAVTLLVSMAYTLLQKRIFKKKKQE